VTTATASAVEVTVSTHTLTTRNCQQYPQQLTLWADLAIRGLAILSVRLAVVVGRVLAAITLVSIFLSIVGFWRGRRLVVSVRGVAAVLLVLLHVVEAES
jgi:hypothetical protein